MKTWIAAAVAVTLTSPLVHAQTSSNNDMGGQVISAPRPQRPAEPEATVSQPEVRSEPSSRIEIGGRDEDLQSGTTSRQDEYRYQRSDDYQWSRPGNSSSSEREYGRAEGQDQRQDQLSVPITVLWGLSDTTTDLLRDAREQLVQNPDAAARKLLAAGNLVELHAAAGEGRDRWGLDDAVRQLDELSQRVENRQIVRREQLDRPVADVLLALADFNHRQAERGLQTNDEGRTAYSLRAGADQLRTAVSLSGQEPSDSVSRALFDTERVARQLVSLIEPSTAQGASYRVTPREERSDFDERSRIFDAARQAGQQQPSGEWRTEGAARDNQQAGTVAQQLPEATRQVVDDFGRAVQDVRSQLR